MLFGKEKVSKMDRNTEFRLLPVGLMAYIGDCVFELLVRKYSLGKGLRKLHDVHQNTISLVNANSQANILREIYNILTDEEKDIVRRGKNANTGNIPKNTEMIDYRMSTGFEALFGYLHLCKQEERISEIWNEIKSNIKE